LPWADLLRRAFGIDVLVCPQCASLRRVLAAMHDPAANARVLGSLGLTAAGPIRRGAGHRRLRQGTLPTRATLRSDGLGRISDRWAVAAGMRCARAAGARRNGTGDQCLDFLCAAAAQGVCATKGHAARSAFRDADFLPSIHRRTAHDRMRTHEPFRMRDPSRMISPSLGAHGATAAQGVRHDEVVGLDRRNGSGLVRRARRRGVRA
jgi:hypothetical protein